MSHARTVSIWLTHWAALWEAHELPGLVRIEPGRRLRRSLGRCEPTTGRVRIHPALFEPEHADLLREVVCHEAAHVAVRLLHAGRVRPHGPEWKALMLAAGYPPAATMDPGRLTGTLTSMIQPRARRGSPGDRSLLRRLRRWL